MFETLEAWAGVVPAKPSPNLLAMAPQKEAGETSKASPQEMSQSKDSVPHAPTEKKLSGVLVPAKAPIREEGSPKSKSSAPAAAKVPSADALISVEGKKQGEILLTDSLVKAVAEKPAAPEALKMPAGGIPVAALPDGGLQPMKVELATEDVIVENPVEREKKRVEVVEEFLRVLKVQGVRLQGTESRILVDGMPIGLGERVGALGLVLDSVEPQKIVFSDASGKKFPKSY